MIHSPGVRNISLHCWILYNMNNMRVNQNQQHKYHRSCRRFVMIPYDRLWYDVKWYNMKWYEMMWNDIICYMMIYDIGTEFYHSIPVQFSGKGLMIYDMLWYGVVWHYMIHYDIVLYGMKWFLLIWCWWILKCSWLSMQLLFFPSHYTAEVNSFIFCGMAQWLCGFDWGNEMMTWGF